jgi:hypothetical protein
MLEAAQKVLVPGEHIAAIHEFSMAVKKPPHIRLLVLTNRHLRVLTFTEKGLFQKNEVPRSLISNTMVPLDRISGLDVTDSGRQRTIISMKVWSEGRCESFAAKKGDALPFVEAMQHVLGLRTFSGDAGSSVSEEIQKLSELAADGVISPEEFTRAKELFLGKAPDARAEAIGLLQNLHGLYRSKVISESEFNTKKWEVLSRRGL